MKTLFRFAGIAILVALAGCASQDAVDESETPVETQAETEAETSEPSQPGPLDMDGIAGFVTGTDQELADGDTVDLPTGGAPTGQLIPTSTNSDVTLYLTRDGSVPSVENNWAGPIDPDRPVLVTRQLEGSGVYKVVAELEGEYSDVVTVYVSWSHEESPQLDTPEFRIGGRRVSGSVEVPVSDGTTEAGRLYITSNYGAATLYISRDGSDPTPDSFWKSQLADGTYLYSAQPTAASYRVIAVWQDSVSPIAALDVDWVE